MNTIEDRIRAAARAAAGTVPPDSVPPLELPAERPRRFRGRHPGARSPGATWAARLAPAAAALAVVTVVISVLAVSRIGTRPPAGTSTASSGLGGPAGPPAGSYVASGQVPRYYVTVTASGGPDSSPSSAEVRATVSGKTLATIAPAGAGRTIVAVTAAADDRTFVLAEQAWARGSGDQWRQAIAFYRVRLSPAGRPGPVSRLPMPISVPAGDMMTGLALSPDGTKLAIAIQLGSDIQGIGLYQVGGGKVRFWSGRGGTIGAPFATRSLSWPASQRALAFNWRAGQSMSVRLLDLGTAGGGLLTHSRPAMTLSNPAGTGQTLYACPGNSIISPDGSAVVCPAAQITSLSPNGLRYSTGFAEFSAATGRVARILGHWPTGEPTGPQVMDVLWSDASGRVLIGVIRAAGRPWVGVISGNEFTPLNVRWIPAAPDFGTW